MEPDKMLTGNEKAGSSPSSATAKLRDGGKFTKPESQPSHL